MIATTITARRLITTSGPLDFPIIKIDSDGTVLEIGTDPTSLASEQDTLTAAFLDVHTHGAVGHDVMHITPAQLSEMQRFLAHHGVANYLPTTVTASIDNTLHALDALANAIESPTNTGEAKPIGIHLEGPFLSHAKRGVHPPKDLLAPSIELFDRFQAAARGHILLMTIAPELVGDTDTAVELIRHAAAQNVKLSLGHTNATAAEARAGIAAGATSATHLFNAMRALDHREPGVVGTLLDSPDTFAELICDGIHVAPELVRLWLKVKGADRGILVTDGMSATGMPDGQYMLGDFDVTVADGRALLTEDLKAGKDTLAGSLLTLDLAVANIQRLAHADLAVATGLASHNPATMLGKPALSQIAVGLPLNCNRFDASNRLTQTIVRGHIVS
ncbi:N-acetylglucosamine-6-phosphate deacetylase [Granulicella paludicola]|uniref:N-acetylglucosamine-6-phosphate deacetylase n=1 Tax=Granulicella paludicola TaxID=474951 RepID=UPI0021DF9B56|nr:N-acetylglucosamine-6-phosphate deacetylase [Granulicella paludicola]